MDIEQVISKSEEFAQILKSVLLDENEPDNKKQIFLMDNQERLQMFLEALQKIILSTSHENTTEELAVFVKRSEETTASIKETLTAYQSKLKIDASTSEDSVPALTQETIEDAMKTNKNTKEISSNMTSLNNKQQQGFANYTHMLVCDGQSFFINGADKVNLELQINTIVEKSSFASIQLFEVQFKQVALHTKTVITL